MRESTCSNCGRPLRPALRGFCPRCVTTPRQRERLERSQGAITREGPLGRALDIAGMGVLLLAGLAGVVAVFLWLGAIPAVITLAVLLVLAVLFVEGG